MGFDWFYWVLLGFTGFYRVLLGFTGFYWVLLGFNWILPWLKVLPRKSSQQFQLLVKDDTSDH